MRFTTGIKDKIGDFNEGGGGEKNGGFQKEEYHS
jgi:hypothetical protein